VSLAELQVRVIESGLVLRGLFGIYEHQAKLRCQKNKYLFQLMTWIPQKLKPDFYGSFNRYWQKYWVLRWFLPWKYANSTPPEYIEFNNKLVSFVKKILSSYPVKALLS
jgi:hypothetical protein